MKHIPLPTVFVALATSYSAYGMQESALGPIEKKIFLCEVDRIGKEATLQKIQETPDPTFFHIKGTTEHPAARTGYKYHTCFTIKKRINPQATDELSQLVAQKINQIENERKRVPNHGNLESYTEYRFKPSQDGQCIKLKSNFNGKNALLAVLNNQ
jgi:hypothetical protein